MNDHEILITYDADAGTLRWYHSDGRRGSDPIGKGLSDDAAAQASDEKAESLGNYGWVSFCIEGGES